MTRWSSLVLVLMAAALAIAVWGCKEDEPDGDADADVDADSDSDTDADSDSDGDGDFDCTEDAPDFVADAMDGYCEEVGGGGIFCTCAADGFDVDEETCDCGEENDEQEAINACEEVGAEEFFSEDGAAAIIDAATLIDEACAGGECDEECAAGCDDDWETCIDECAGDPDCEAGCDEDDDACLEECG